MGGPAVQTDHLYRMEKVNIIKSGKTSSYGRFSVFRAEITPTIAFFKVSVKCSVKALPAANPLRSR